MKTLLMFLVLIGWSVLQARRKAMRQNKKIVQMREEAAQAQPATFGATKYPEDEPDPEAELPSEIQRMLEYSRARARASRDYTDAIEAPEEAVQPEVVQEIVKPVEVDAYEAVAPTRQDISFDRSSLRTFFVTREVLGPPRSRKRFVRRIKAQD